MNIFVKICGITSSNDANLAAEFGADAIGLNQYKQSPRYVEESGLINIKENLDNNILIVPVFVDPNVQEVHRFIDIFPKNEQKKYVQFYRKILDNICFSDYIDRITFQKQIWQAAFASMTF